MLVVAYGSEQCQSAHGKIEQLYNTFAWRSPEFQTNKKKGKKKKEKNLLSVEGIMSTQVT